MFSGMKGAGFPTPAKLKVKDVIKDAKKPEAAVTRVSSVKQPTQPQQVNFVSKSMKKKPGTVLMAKVRADFGPGSPAYSAMVTLVAEIKKKKKSATVTSGDIQKRIDSCFEGVNPPIRISQDRREKYLDLLLQVAGVSAGVQGANVGSSELILSASVSSFMPAMEPETWSPGPPKSPGPPRGPPPKFLPKFDPPPLKLS